MEGVCAERIVKRECGLTNAEKRGITKFFKTIDTIYDTVV